MLGSFQEPSTPCTTRCCPPAEFRASGRAVLPRWCGGRRRSRDLTTLVDELCVDLGFCLSPEDYEQLWLSSWERADDLTDAVFAAEGLTPPYDLRLWRIRRRVIPTFELPDCEHPQLPLRVRDSAECRGKSDEGRGGSVEEA